MPKVSVIIPVYGMERYIERCAVSLFEQTLSDLEFIFVDDCSPDRSMEILSQVIEKYKICLLEKNCVVRTERMPKNSGLPAVRKYGTSLATGDFIIHCDSDDWLDVTFCQKLYDKAIAEGSDLVVTGYHETDGKVIIRESIPVFTTKSEYVSRLLYMQDSWAIWNKLCRRELYDGLEFSIYNMGEDMLMTFQLVVRAKKISVVEESLYNYYYNVDSMTKVQDEGKMYNNWKQSVFNAKQTFDFLKKENLESCFADAIEYQKYRQKILAGRIAYKSKYAKEWYNEFSSTHESYLRIKGLSFEEKLKYFIVVFFSWIKS